MGARWLLFHPTSSTRCCGRVSKRQARTKSKIGHEGEEMWTTPRSLKASVLVTPGRGRYLLVRDSSSWGHLSLFPSEAVRGFIVLPCHVRTPEPTATYTQCNRDRRPTESHTRSRRKPECSYNPCFSVFCDCIDNALSLATAWLRLSVILLLHGWHKCIEASASVPIARELPSRKSTGVADSPRKWRVGNVSLALVYSVGGRLQRLVGFSPIC